MSRKLMVALGLGAALVAAAARGESIDDVKARFVNPSEDYASGPLWVWNDWMTEENVRSGLRDLASQKVRQAFVHPRPGLMTPYLSDEWFRLWGIALDEARRLDMNLWIYDENSYPSGFAGGHVPEAMPESRVVNIVAQEHATLPNLDDDTLAVFRLRDGQAEYVTRDAAADAPGPLLVVSLRYGPVQPWFGGTWYVDLLRPGVTEKFLEVTLEAYRKHFGDEFGKRIPGAFTDEPNLSQAGGLPWTPGLPELFEQRWGYSLVDNLPSLFRAAGDWRRVRHNYFTLLHEQFVARWAKPYHDYCERHGLEFTGHYWEHEWPNCRGVPDNMGMYAWSQRPAIDILFNQYQERNHAQVGNVRAVKELSSVANQLGRKRTLCEAYGGGGWDLRLEDMKRIGDWLYVLGVNTLDEHLADTTLRGARKHDYPQSFSYHATWWEAYHCCAEYFTRLSAALSAGEQVNEVLVIEPTTTAWMYQVDPGSREKLEGLGESFFSLVLALERSQVEFDLGDEPILADHGSVDPATGRLRVGRRVYSTVVLPQGTENLDRKTVELLEAAKHSAIWCVGDRPTYVEGRPAEPLTQRVADACVGLGQETVVQRLTAARDGSLIVQQDEGDEGILFHHRRRLEEGDELVFLVNSSLDHPCAGTIRTSARGVEQWNLSTGAFAAYPFEPAGDGKPAALRFKLPPAGSLLLALSARPNAPGKPAAQTATALAASGPLEIRRLEPNVLTLDYVDVTVGGETQPGLRVPKAAQFAFKQNGVESGNPWDRAVQLRDTLITRTFPDDSGLEASYHFTIEGPVPQPLEIVVERPDLYAVTCNGQPVQAQPGRWWLDKAFGRIDVSKAAVQGDNTVTLAARPMTIWHELAAVYVLGDFALRPAERGFAIVPPQPLAMAPAMLAHGVESDGAMWLSAGIGYASQSDAAADDRAPWVQFDLGRATDVDALEIWNYNENYAGDLTSRGVAEMEIRTSATGDEGSFQPLRTVRLAKGKGTPTAAQTVQLDARGVRFVRFDVKANHAGTRFPAEGQPKDSGFVGLGEVRFFTPGSREPLAGVKAAASSELASHNRLAKYLVDGSGVALEAAGWDQQGLPFYGQGVGYRQRFEIGKVEGRYRVTLPAWSGSVAKVLVNGELAGWIPWQPYACDVTDALGPGSNEIEVVVIGTLKNTVGPHHGGTVRGIASPWHFDAGAQPGPPPGGNYDTIGYGLFAPPLLEQVR